MSGSGDDDSEVNSGSRPDDLTTEVKGMDYSPVPTRALEHVREDNAFLIAKAILWLFAVCFALSFLLVIALVYFAARFPALVLTQLAPALDNFSRFISLVGSLFSPLLAFILGFYFSSERRHRNIAD